MADDDPFGGNADPFGDPTAVAPISNLTVQRREEEERIARFNQLLNSIWIASKPIEDLAPGSHLRPILTKANLSLEKLKQVWSLTDTKKRGSLTKQELATCLKLIAFAQQDKPLNVEEAIAANVYPAFDDFSQVQVTAKTPTNAAAPVAALGGMTIDPSKSTTAPVVTTFSQGTIEIKVAAEKGGSFLKHTNYIVKTKIYGVEVIRRYSDFDWLQEVLLRRYPFRIIPELPPKRIAGPEDENFIEQRRRGLIRFSEFIIQHPVLRDDETVTFFLKDDTPEGLATYRKTRVPSVPNIQEEFLFNPMAPSAKQHVPAEAENILKNVKDRLPALLSSLSKLADTFENVIKRSEGNARDYTRIGQMLQFVVESEYPVDYLKMSKNPKYIADRFEDLGKINAEMAIKSGDAVLQSIKHHQGVVGSFLELFNRRVSTTQKDHQFVIKRIQNNRQKVNVLAAKGKTGKSVDSLIAEIEQDEKDLEILQKRDEFATYCLWMEMLYFNQNKAFITSFIQDFIKTSTQLSGQETSIWKALVPLVEDLPTSGFV